MSLNIASAFRLRNKLKMRIKELTTACVKTSVTKTVGIEENTASFDGKSFAQAIKNVSLLMATLKDFNHAIEKANAINKEDLINMETLKAELAFYDTIVHKIRKAEMFEYEYNPEGGRNKVELELVLNRQTMVERYNKLRMQKDALEEKLAISNFNAKVDFDKEVINRLL